MTDEEKLPWRLIIGGAITPGCFFSWVYITSFTPILFGMAPTASNWFFIQEFVAFLGFVVALGYRAVRERSNGSFSQTTVIILSVVAAFATVLMELTCLISSNLLAIVLICVAAFPAGLTFGLVFIEWVQLYAAQGDVNAMYLISGMMLSTTIFSAAAIVLPLVGGMVLLALLPLCAGISLTRKEREPIKVAPEDKDADTVKARDLFRKEGYRLLPRRMIFGIIAMGLVYGITQDFTLTYDTTRSTVANDCLVVDLAITVLLLVYAKRTGKNFGYSSLCLIIVPIAGFAQGMIAVFRLDGLGVSFLFMRLAYMLFDVMIWLQLPKVYQRYRTIRIFLVVYLIFEVSVVIGLAGHKLLMLTGFSYFNYTALFCLALLLTALTFSFADGSVGTIWNLMPEKMPYTGKFRRACKRIEKEYGLTKRESEIVELVLRGRSGPYIEEQLVISKNTYQTHMRNAYAKIGVHSQQELLDILEDTIEEERAEREKADGHGA